IWSGLYVGGTVGFGTGDTSGKLDIDIEEKEYLRSAVAPDGVGGDDFVDAIEAFLATDYDMDGAVYGAHVGYNWQRGNAVFGIEAGLNGTDFDGHTDCVIGLVDCNRELDYYARVVGRLGYAVDNLLFYGFGGVAWGDVQTKISAFGEPVDDLLGGETSFDNEQTHVGWTAGAGLEFAFTDRFFAGVEYAHVDLGEESYNVFSYEGCDCDIDIDNNVDMSFDVIKIRASYKLWDRDREPIDSYK
ncbi:MAG: outer membrane protein, partial [Dichotomicrobium sp.]